MMIPDAGNHEMTKKTLLAGNRKWIHFYLQFPLQNSFITLLWFALNNNCNW
jgi:hypothetical protein